MSDRAAHSVSGTPRRARAKRDEKGARAPSRSQTRSTQKNATCQGRTDPLHTPFFPPSRSRDADSAAAADARGLAACRARQARAPRHARGALAPRFRRDARAGVGVFFGCFGSAKAAAREDGPPPRAKKHSRDERGDSAPGAPPTRLIGVPEHMSLLRRAVYGALAWHSDLANGRALHEQQKSWRAQCCVWQQRSVFADMLDTQNSCILSDRCTPQRSH